MPAEALLAETCITSPAFMRTAKPGTHSYKHFAVALPVVETSTGYLTRPYLQQFGGICLVYGDNKTYFIINIQSLSFVCGVLWKHSSGVLLMQMRKMHISNIVLWFIIPAVHQMENVKLFRLFLVFFNCRCLFFLEVFASTESLCSCFHI